MMAEIKGKALTQQMVNDLTNIGMSYSRIAYRIGVSPSSIHKLMTHPEREPRIRTLIKLSLYYQKIFSAPELYGSQIKVYYETHQADIVKVLQLMMEYRALFSKEQPIQKSL